MPNRPPFSRRGEQAIQAAQEAALADAMPRIEDGDDAVYGAQARFARARAESYLAPASPALVSSGEAVGFINDEPDLAPGLPAWIADTLAQPNCVSVGASNNRTSAAHAVGVLEAAVDAAASAHASNSIEKMLCHQLAAVHFTAMRLLERTASTTLPPVEAARLTNAAARMMDIYQAGCLTLQKLKAHGQQRVLVQYQQVNVGSGGQALVAGRMGRGSRRRGRGGKNAQ